MEIEIQATSLTNSHTSTGKSSEGRLSTGTGSLGSSSTGGSDLDVESGDSDFTASNSDILSSQHGGVRR